MAASFPTQNNHAREAVVIMPSVLDTLADQQNGSLTLPIHSGDWSRVPISMEDSNNDLHSFHSFEKMHKHNTSMGTISILSPNITSDSSYTNINASIGDPNVMDANSLALGMQSTRNSLIVPTKENQVSSINPNPAAYHWNKNLSNSQVYSGIGIQDHRIAGVSNHYSNLSDPKFMPTCSNTTEYLDINSNHSMHSYLQYYNMTTSQWQQYRNPMNYQPFTFPEHSTQPTYQMQEYNGISGKLFNTKEETVVGWWLNELGQPVYSMPSAIMNDAIVGSTIKDDAETDNGNNDSDNPHLYQSIAPQRYQSSLTKSGSGTNIHTDPEIKRERRSRQSEDQKRNNHLASERKRRANYKNALTNLSKLIPRGSGAESQSCLIWKAVNFIRSLEQTNNMLRFKLHDLMNRY